MIDWDLMYELDWDGCVGEVIGVTIRGHVEDDVAVPIAWAALAEDDDGTGPISPPRRIWIRKIPRRDECGDVRGSRYQFLSAPGRGATPTTLVEVACVPPQPCEATR